MAAAGSIAAKNFIPVRIITSQDELEEQLDKISFGKEVPAVVFSQHEWTVPHDRDLFDESISISAREQIVEKFQKEGRVLVRSDFEPAPYPAELECSLSDPRTIQEVFDKYGVVIIKDILNKQECEASVNEVWKTIEDLSEGDVKPENPATWDEWPNGQQFGLIGMGTLKFLEPQACLNRVKVYEAYRAVMREEELMTNITRAGCMRPTRDVWYQGRPHDKPEWKSISEWLHIDMNPFTGQSTSFGFTETGGTTSFRGYEHPWREREKYLAHPELRTQGILALADCPVGVGGFHAVPGFHKFIHTWAALHAATCLEANSHSGDPSTVQIPAADPVRPHIQRFPLRAGSLLIWNTMLPHGNFPNEGAGPASEHDPRTRCRYVQYVHMASIHDPVLHPYPLLPADVPVPLSPLGRRLYGFEPWPSARGKERYKCWQQELNEEDPALAVGMQINRIQVEQQRAFREYIKKTLARP